LINVNLESQKFIKTLENIVSYSNGFLEGAQKGKPALLKKIGESTISALGQFVDAMARSDREALHHVYEWYREGSPEARLFDLNYVVSKTGLSLNGTFRQSSTTSADATKPFYDKARIMELGIPVTITPSGGGVLRFNDGGQEVFTKRPVTINNPGGDDVRGSFERVFNIFMQSYFRQSFLKASGLADHLKNPVTYKQNISLGARQGRAAGARIGYTWIANANVGVENV
jgi:hypothetical protein